MESIRSCLQTVSHSQCCLTISRLSVGELFGKIELALAGNLDSLHETEGNSTPMPGNEDRPELETDSLWKKWLPCLSMTKRKLAITLKHKMPIPELGIEIGTGTKVLGELERGLSA